MATARDTGNDYIQTLNPQGYINNREITNLPGVYLVKGSRDCLIVNKEKVSSRKGTQLLGTGKTKNKGHKSSYDWETHLNTTRSVRMNDDGDLEVYFVNKDGTGDFYSIKSFTAGARANFAPWWSSTEGADILLFVTQTAEVHEWSGGVAQVQSSTANSLTLSGTKTATTIAFVEGGSNADTITDSGNGFIDAGFVAGQTITVSGSASNDGTYTIRSVTAGTITLFDDDDLANEAAGSSVTITIPNNTWAEKGFLTAGTRKVVIGGTEYAYTGGESTATLTGLSGVPSVTAGDVIVQAVRTTSPATLSGLTLDLIAVWNNHVLYGDLTSRVVYMSTDTAFGTFTKSTPRAPGEGETFTFDSTPTAFIISGNDTEEFFVSGRKNDWYKVESQLSDDIGAEYLRIRKLPTSTGQAARSQGAVIEIKNATAFLTFEPTLDTLGRIGQVDSPTSFPLSHDIKDDITAYDLTDAHGIFYQNQIFITLPVEGVVLIYDTQDQLWQPPHYMSIGRLALIDVDGNGTQVLCGHAANSNETYKLYTGYNDNNAPIRTEMHFGYENYGSRFLEKSCDEIATELYMSENTVVTNKIVYDFQGATDIREFEIDGGDSSGIRFKPNSSASLGQNPLGNQPLGSLATSVDDLSKFRVVDTTSLLDFFERQRVFISESMDARWSVIAYGENVQISDNIPAFIKR